MAPTNRLEPFLTSRGFVVLDGGLATELERRGAVLDDPLWSAKLLIEAPEVIEALHYDYFVAGADIGTSASYQATFPGFAARGIDRQRAESLFHLSVELVARARDRFWAVAEHRASRLEPLIAASVGPYGAFLHDGSEYRGDYGISADELAEFHHRRLETLARADADLFACETIPSREEGEVLATLLDALDRPGWISFSCRDSERLSTGEPFAEAARAAAHRPAVLAVGVNCTPPQYATELLRSARDIPKPLVCYPNSGERWDAASSRWLGHASSPDEIPGREALSWYEAGARLIGGCCRSGPEDIAARRRALSAHTAR